MIVWVRTPSPKRSAGRWATEALRRLDEIESGAEEAIDADEVFADLGLLSSR
ncbi:MAG: addiction module protein [Chloracidobacterium sp.]|nr:addiction module protein [Chloracidobacterium sp.]